MTHESVSVRPSRRSALTMLVSSTAALAIAAPAAAAVVASAPGLPARGVDPAFAAIERHRAAWKEWDAAADDLTAREDTLSREFVGSAWIAVPEVTVAADGTLMLSVEDGAAKILRPLMPGESLESLAKVHCYRAYSNKDIDRYLSGDGAAIERARQEARRLLRSAKRRTKRAREAAGIPGALQRREDAWTAERDALYDLTMTVPTSADGAVAVFAYWFKHTQSDGIVGDESDYQDMLRLLKSLNAAFVNIAAPHAA